MIFHARNYQSKSSDHFSKIELFCSIPGPGHPTPHYLCITLFHSFSVKLSGRYPEEKTINFSSLRPTYYEEYSWHWLDQSSK